MAWVVKNSKFMYQVSNRKTPKYDKIRISKVTATMITSSYLGAQEFFIFCLPV